MPTNRRAGRDQPPTTTSPAPFRGFDRDAMQFCHELALRTSTLIRYDLLANLLVLGFRRSGRSEIRQRNKEQSRGGETVNAADLKSAAAKAAYGFKPRPRHWNYSAFAAAVSEPDPAKPPFATRLLQTARREAGLHRLIVFVVHLMFR